MSQVVVVEPIGFVRHTISSALKAEGHVVHDGECGHWALRTLSESLRVDVVIAADRTKNLSAVELFRRARRIDRLADDGGSRMPAFVLTVAIEQGQELAEHRTVREALDLGFTDALAKPISTDELVETVRRLTTPTRTPVGTAASAEREPAAGIAAASAELTSVATAAMPREELLALRERLGRTLDEVDALLAELPQPPAPE